MSACSETGCEGRVVARGLCGKHYQRARSAGMPVLPKRTPAERFWSFVNKTETCWLWTGKPGLRGYGDLSIDNKNVKAHRFSYELAKGPIPEGLVIDHLCRTPLCVNPDHLEPVTQRVNVLRGESPMGRQARQTHCIHGHEFTDENTQTHGGHRRCRTCIKAHTEKRWGAA